MAAMDASETSRLGREILRSKHLFMAATAQVIWLCACVSSWPHCGLGVYFSVEIGIVQKGPVVKRIPFLIRTF